MRPATLAPLRRLRSYGSLARCAPSGPTLLGVLRLLRSPASCASSGLAPPWRRAPPHRLAALLWRPALSHRLWFDPGVLPPYRRDPCAFGPRNSAACSVAKAASVRG